MHVVAKGALILVTTISYLPAAGWTIVLVASAFNGLTRPTEWIQLFGVLALLASIGMIVGVGSMLVFVVTGKKTIPRALMALLIAVGLAINGWGTVAGVRHGSMSLAILGAAPFLCAALLLYLGRAYFSPPATARNHSARI